jgi:hypothetical protein
MSINNSVLYELDYRAQGAANRKLLSAVVALAIQDAQSKPRRMGRLRIPTDEAISAIYFLFQHSDTYLSILDIDPQQFRERLLKLMFDMNKKVSQFEPIKRRNFRYNYEWMRRKENILDLTKAYEAELEKLDEDEQQ